MAPENAAIINDEGRLIRHARAGNSNAQEALFKRYKPVLNILAQGYRSRSGDADDLRQEGRIGFFNAIRHYDASRNSSFSTFASLCMRRQIISALRTGHTNNQGILNNSVPLEEGATDIPSDVNPEDQVLLNEMIADFQDQVERRLSEHEYRIMRSYLLGKPYQEMAEELRVSLKAVDNALRSIRQKLETILSSRPLSCDMAASVFRSFQTP